MKTKSDSHFEEVMIAILLGGLAGSAGLGIVGAVIGMVGGYLIIHFGRKIRSEKENQK